jgi:hypothetical protein
MTHSGHRLVRPLKPILAQMRHSGVVQPVRINVFAIQIGEEYAQADGD